jgi:hypothetical protein
MERALVAFVLAALAGVTLGGCAASGARVAAESRRGSAIEHRRALPGPLSGPNEAENARASRARHAAAQRAGQGSGADSGSWQERGSSNQAGRTQVTVPALDGRTLLIGTAGGGIFAGSPEAGWQPRGDNLGFGASGFGVKHLLVSPGSPETWFAAGYFYDAAVSRDRGASWSKPMGLPDVATIYRAVHDGGDPRTLYLLAQRADAEPQLFRSADGGLHFTGLATFPVIQRDFSPTYDLWTSRTSSGPLYVLQGDGQLSVSTDRGATFSPLGRAGTGDTNLAVLAGSEAGGPTLYALLGKDYQNWHLFASGDGGRHWEPRFALGDIFYSGNGGLGTSAENPDLVLFGGAWAYRSTDGGRKFTQIGSDYYQDPEHQLHLDIDGIEVVRWRGRESIFVDTDGGTFLSQDGGATFENVTLHGFPDSQYYSTLTSPENPDLIAAGSQDQGLQLSHPAPGVEAFDQPFGGDLGNLTTSAGSFKHLFAAGPGAGVLYWPDPGAGTEALSVSVPLQRYAFLAALVADPADPRSFYMGGDHIWHGQHAERGREAILTQLPQDFSGGGTDYVTAFAISPADRHYWYAVTFQGALWSSHDGGATWSGPHSVPTYFSGTAVLPSTRDPRTCFAAGQGAAGVYVTTDGGATWSPMSTGLPPTYVAALAFDDPATENLYAASYAGPFRFDADAGIWVSLLGTQAPLTKYLGVEGVPAAKRVRFATFGRGIWDYLPAGSGPPPPPPTRCVPDSRTLCLGAGRFLVRATWLNQFDGSGGAAGAIPRTDAAGFFSFGDPANVELLVKVLPFDTAVKVFYGELTNLRFTLTVTDLRTGAVKTYRNTAGDCGGIDQAAFPKSALSARRGISAAAGSFRPGPTTLCLMNGRFALAVDWSNPGNGTSGKAGAVRLPSDLTGAFFFTDPGNLELLAKVLNLGDRIAVFYGALSDLDYTLTVTDTLVGTARTYHNPAGTFCGGLDNAAFLP